MIGSALLGVEGPSIVVRLSPPEARRKVARIGIGGRMAIVRHCR